MSGQSRRQPIWYKQAKALAGNDTYFVKVRLPTGIISSIQIAWHTTASEFTVKLYTSNLDGADVPASGAAGAVDIEQWTEETAIVPVGVPSAGAVGSSMLHMGNNGAKEVLLAFLLTAASTISVLPHSKE